MARKRTAPSQGQYEAPALPLELSQQASRLLASRHAARPVQTLGWAAVAGLTAMIAGGEVQDGRIHSELPLDLLLNALFDDWDMGARPWPPKAQQEGLRILQQILTGRKADLPALPAFPHQPSASPGTLELLWHHLDLAGWRALRFTLEPNLAAHLPEEPKLGRLMAEAVDLLDQFHRILNRAWSDHGASPLAYTEELAGLLHRIHGVLATAAERAGHDPLGWPVPDYSAILATPFPLPAGPRGAVLPGNLMEALEQALRDRRSSRPTSTVLPLLQRYAEQQRALDPDWNWSAARDGRELAFLVFESGLQEAPDWTPEESRNLCRLCTAVHDWGRDLPVPPFPPLVFDPADGTATTLWVHHDLLFLGGMLATAVGAIPMRGEAHGTKSQRRTQQSLATLQPMVWGTLHHWGAMEMEVRREIAGTLPTVFAGGYQQLRAALSGPLAPFRVYLPEPEAGLAPRPAYRPKSRFQRARKR